MTRDRDVVGQLIDHTLILSVEAQTELIGRYSGLSWRVDLSEPPVFWFECEPAAAFRPHFIGSSSAVTNTWLWGWENINKFPEPVVSLARHVREVGARLGAAELTTAYQNLHPAERVYEGLIARGMPEAVFVYCAQALSELPAPVYYRAPNGTGHSWFLLDNPNEFSLPAPTVVSAAAAMMRALQTGDITDHRLAVTAYAQRRQGLSLQSAGTDRMIVGAPDGQVVIGLDEFGRIAEIETCGGSV
ncbi:DUF6882 domain-containing protein [Mycobacterium sp. SMC-21]|uniref:DUF6882 domain-containing protein n=1 Tax=unclassified Mycobacterium TaxID=2642494 RepID=UPI00115457F3|nr:DUF6882 domain-containing protein [Mycobacterium sp. ST-F2]